MYILIQKNIAHGKIYDIHVDRYIYIALKNEITILFFSFSMENIASHGKKNDLKTNDAWFTLPETNIFAPENWWLEDVFPNEIGPFSGAFTVRFREDI